MHRKIKSRARQIRWDQTEQIQMAKKKPTLDELTSQQMVKELILKNYRKMYPNASDEEAAYMALLVDWVDQMPWPPPPRRQKPRQSQARVLPFNPNTDKPTK
jgi:hypothetical protein